ncbi:hypothetical protein ACFYU9_29090 [Streptomyces sp. NPDC004327]|uniref:hypothetical protein n=1 Tax=Streptomyces sp. NPDC004327 TaxID=3364699 RepID=UPI003679D714
MSANPSGALPPGVAPLTARHREIALMQRVRGRSGLEPAEREALGSLYDGTPADAAGDEGEVLRLLTRPFSREVTVPEYYQYTCMHVYAWFLEHWPKDPVGAGLLALHTTLVDLLDVERAVWPVGGPVPRPDHVAERVALLESLIGTVRGTTADPFSLTPAGELVDRAALDPESARRVALLAECTRFPRSDRHEEHVFLRAVQACESVFFLVRHLAVEVADAAGEDPAGAARRLAQAADCAELLNGIFRVLLTLSPEGFMTFREQTGQASAVQSLGYNSMEIAVYGFDPRKGEVYDSIGHLDVLNSPAVTGYRALSAVVAGTGDPALAEGWTRLDRSLSRWRGSHYRFARTYLPSGVEASGGTEGAAYVKKFVKKDACLPGQDPVSARELLSGFLFR